MSAARRSARWCRPRSMESKRQRHDHQAGGRPASHRAHRTAPPRCQADLDRPGSTAEEKQVAPPASQKPSPRSVDGIEQFLEPATPFPEDWLLPTYPASNIETVISGRSPENATTRTPATPGTSFLVDVCPSLALDQKAVGVDVNRAGIEHQARRHCPELKIPAAPGLRISLRDREIARSGRAEVIDALDVGLQQPEPRRRDVDESGRTPTRSCARAAGRHSCAAAEMVWPSIGPRAP